jgi:hypothetical protein
LRLFRPARVNIVQDYFRALQGEPFAYLKTDALPGACNNGNFVCEWHAEVFIALTECNQNCEAAWRFWHNFFVGSFYGKNPMGYNKCLSVRRSFYSLLCGRILVQQLKDMLFLTTPPCMCGQFQIKIPVRVLFRMALLK